MLDRGQCSKCSAAHGGTPPLCVFYYPPHAPIMFHRWLSSGGGDTRVRCYLSGPVHGATWYCWIVVSVLNVVQHMSERPLCRCSTRRHAPIMFHRWLSSGGGDTGVRFHLSQSIHDASCYCWIVVSVLNVVQHMSKRPLCVCSTTPARTHYIPPLAQ